MAVAKKVKLGLLRVAKGLGAFSLVQNSGWRQQRLAILCYHGVSIQDEHEWSPSFYMSPANFELRMRALRDGGYSVLPLGKALRQLHEGTLPQRSVSLTFDDGSADFATRTHPILRKFGFPATVYLTTYYCGRPKPVFGVFCSYMLWKGRDRRRLSRGLIDQSGEWDISSASGRHAALSDIRGYVEGQHVSESVKEDFTNKLATELGLDHADLINRRILQVMSEDEVTRLAECGVDFELHTHRHRLSLDRALFEREISDNRARIRALTTREPQHFCYPSGEYEYSFLEWLRAGEVMSATTCESGLATRTADPLLLPRVVDGGQLTSIEFESWLTGIAAMLPRRVAHSPKR